MADNTKFDSAIESMFNGMTNLLTTKTVVGEPIHIGDTIILPLVDISFGMGAGSSVSSAKNSTQGGMGGKISPNSVLVIQNGTSRIVNIKNQDTVTKILDMVPDFIDKVSDKIGKGQNSKNSSNKNDNEEAELSDEEIIDAATSAVNEQ